MSLNKAIKYGKEFRKPYYKSERFDRSCRPHGGCPYCLSNRMHKHLKNLMNAEDTRKEIDGALVLMGDHFFCKEKVRVRFP